jgi:hypothetical protein
VAGSLTQQLVEQNFRLTELLVQLATEIIRGEKVVTQKLIPVTPAIPSFEEHAKNLTEEERLFYTEEEEDERYTQALSGDTSSNPQLTKEILEAAGHHDLAAQVTAT